MEKESGEEAKITLGNVLKHKIPHMLVAQGIRDKAECKRGLGHL